MEQMILNRAGNKEEIAHLIIKEFPQHSCYIELFFGAGGLFFNKPKSPWNILNDKDKNVINLWQCVQDNPDLLIEKYLTLPVSEHFMTKDYKNYECEDKYVQAAIFLMRSNCGLYGKGYTLAISKNTNREMMPKLMETLKRLTKDCIFLCKDYEDAIRTFEKSVPENAFIYADPPYVGTNGAYIESFNKDRLEGLVTHLLGTELKFAISEFDSDEVLNIAKDYDLNVIQIVTRQSIKKRSNEILLTNYKRLNTLF